ncbi:LysR family transcriptional regulator [Thalassovita aquimarina]|uniref:LysR family transcriptional regulator n=1 Tax=Thalassovita aquimarina TaxID=2785917 RepID=A0ABS5HTB3_9RHOB|nr:LysR family transcriptional regulator [Thalassovita aquimarina]MBR9652160.1 LysR family transcriptional regulator [Thalassovita aquimarina]
MNLTRLPPLNALRAFAAFHQAGSMAAAGTLLNVSHAAISQQIKALESHLGLPLLDRRPRKPVLTDAGFQLAITLERSLGEIAQMTDALTGAEAERPVQISTTPAFASGWLMPRLADFRQKHPEVSLMIDPTAEVKPLRPGGIDVALRYGVGNWPGLEASLLVESPIVVVAAPELVPKDGPLTPAELARLPWLQELGTHESSDWLRQQGVEEPPASGMTSLPGNLVMEEARAGRGAAVLARAFVEADIAAGRLRVLFQDDRKKGYYIVTRPGVQRPAMRAFTKWLIGQR